MGGGLSRILPGDCRDTPGGFRGGSPGDSREIPGRFQWNSSGRSPEDRLQRLPTTVPPGGRRDTPGKSRCAPVGFKGTSRSVLGESSGRPRMAPGGVLGKLREAPGGSGRPREQGVFRGAPWVSPGGTWGFPGGKSGEIRGISGKNLVERGFDPPGTPVSPVFPPCTPVEPSRIHPSTGGAGKRWRPVVGRCGGMW